MEPDYTNDPAAREQLVSDLIEEFDWPYPYIAVEETAVQICAYLDGSESRYRPSHWAAEDASEYMAQIEELPSLPDYRGRNLYTQAVADAVAFLEDWAAGRVAPDDPRGGAVIVADVFILADLWCPHHEEQLDILK